MAFRQPRVPEFRESEGARAYIKTLILFLKDFTMAAWTADHQREKDVTEIRKRLDALEGKGE